MSVLKRIRMVMMPYLTRRTERSIDGAGDSAVSSEAMKRDGPIVGNDTSIGQRARHGPAAAFVAIAIDQHSKLRRLAAPLIQGLMPAWLPRPWQRRGAGTAWMAPRRKRRC